MTTMSDYTPDGWKIIMGMFSNATAAVSQADMTGDEDCLRESVRAIQRFDVEQHENELICSCIHWYNEQGYFPLPQQGLERQMIALREGAALVDMKTSLKESLEFKHFVMQVALDVARAYTEEEDGSPVSEKEAEVLAQVKEKLYFPDYEWRVVVSALANVTAAVIQADVADDSVAAFEEAMHEAAGVSSLFGDLVYGSDAEVVSLCVRWLRRTMVMPEAAWDFEDKMNIVRDAVILVRRRMPDEVDAYRQFVFDVAQKTAEAYAERDGKAVSEKEAAVLHRLGNVLGVQEP